MIDRLMTIASIRQAIIDFILIGLNQAPRGYRLGDQGLDGRLLHMRHHLVHHLSVAVQQIQDGWLFIGQGAASPFAA
jgi:hypothetical protein